MDELFSHVVHWTWWIIAVVLIILEVSAPGTFFLWMGVSAGVVGVGLDRKSTRLNSSHW